MENQYTGDVGDFGKLGLLRALRRACPELSLGIDWYLVPDDGTTDGRHTAYLDSNPELCACDPALARLLADVVRSGRRNVSEYRDRDAVPGATYFDETLVRRAGARDNLERRAAWHAAGLAALAGTDVVFVDPDIGLEVPSTGLGSARGGKYVARAEIADHYERGRSVIVYNHRDRSSAERYVARLDLLKSHLGIERPLPVLRFRRYSVRDYVFALRPEHVGVVGAFCDEFVAGPWGAHFSRFDV